MPDNEVKITITARDDTNAAFGSVAARSKAVEDAITRSYASQARAAKILSAYEQALAKDFVFTDKKAQDSGGVFSNLGNILTGKLLPGITGLMAAGPGGAAALTALSGTAAIAAVVAGGLAAIIAGPLLDSFALIAVGIGAFAAAAIPAFSQLKASLTALSTATSAYQQASLNLDQAIRKSPADMKAYQATIHGLEPDLQNAARLLTNQNAAWQNLSPSMQKSVVALSNNSAAYKSLLPSQQAALNALMAQKAAWDALSPAQQKMATGLGKIKEGFADLTRAVQPQVIKAFAEGVKILNQLLPTLEPLAKAAGRALDTLLKNISGWLASGAGKKFIAWMQTEGPQAIATFGRVMWDVIRGVGRTLDFLRNAGESWLKNFRILWHDAAGAADWFRTGFIGIGHSIEATYNSQRHAASVALDAIRVAWVTAGHAIEAAWNALRNATNAAFSAIVGVIRSALGTVVGIIRSAVGAIRAAWSAVYSAIVAPVENAYHAVLGFVGAIRNALGGIAGAVNSALGGIPGRVLGFLGLEAGGIVGAASGMMGGGLRMVGEHGRELVRLPMGSQVLSSPDTERMLAGTGGGGGTVTLEIAPGAGGAVEQFLAEILRKFVRVRGGNVQQVLGR